MSFLQQQISLNALFGPKRLIQNITVDAILDENTVDSLSITKQPVQQGASIADHSFLEPTAFSMRILQQVKNPITQLTSTFQGGGSSGLSQLYQEFLKLQSSRSTFSITTPKRIYTNMLLAVIRVNTDKNTENILSLNLSFQQVFIVSISTVQVARVRQKNPGATGATQPAGKKSLALDIKEAAQRTLGRLP